MVCNICEFSCLTDNTLLHVPYSEREANGSQSDSDGPPPLEEVSDSDLSELIDVNLPSRPHRIVSLDGVASVMRQDFYDEHYADHAGRGDNRQLSLSWRVPGTASEFAQFINDDGQLSQQSLSWRGRVPGTASEVAQLINLMTVD
jgi:hypothetical protein